MKAEIEELGAAHHHSNYKLLLLCLLCVDCLSLSER